MLFPAKRQEDRAHAAAATRDAARSAAFGLVAALVAALALGPWSSSLAQVGGGGSTVFAWIDHGFGLETTDVTAVAVSPDRPGEVWVGAGGAVHRSLDGGLTWERLAMLRGIGAFGLWDDEEEDAEIDELDLRDAAEELADEVRERILDDLISEVGIELAEILADEVVESLIEELIQEADGDLPDGVDRRRLRERFDADAEDIEEYERVLRGLTEDARREREDRVHRIAVGEEGRVAVGTSAGLLVTLDGGETFRQVLVGLGEGGREVFAVRWSPAEPERLFAGTEEGLWVSSDLGVTFSRAGGTADRGAVRDVAVCPMGSGVVLVATARGLLRSTDGGLSFSETWNPVDEDLADVRAVDFDGAVAGRAYAATSGGLLVSRDSGETFTRIEPAGLTAREITDVRAWPRHPGALAVATSSGVFASRDGAEHFQEAYPGLPAREIRAVATVPRAYPELYVATPAGLFRWEQVPDDPPRAEWVGEVMARAPPLSHIAEAALEWSEIDSGWFQGAYDRARRAWLLPQLGTTVRLVDNRRLRHVDQWGVPARRQFTFDDDLRWEVRAMWNLDSAIHDDGRVAVSRAWGTLRAERARILDRVSASYAAWVSLSVRARQISPLDVREAVMLDLQISESEAQLDALTGGFFTRHLRGRPPSQVATDVR